jgi:hypothetical protein
MSTIALFTQVGANKLAGKHGIHRIPDQPYLPHLAISCLCLFSTVKEKLEWIHLADEDQFFECLQGVFSGLDQRELNRVF